MLTIVSTEDVRLKNLRKLIEKHGGPTSFASHLGYGSASYFVQIGGPNPSRPISEKTARRIERSLGLKSGWMDEPEADEKLQTIDSERLANSIELVINRCEEEKLPTSPKRIAKLTSIAYESNNPLTSVNNYIEVLKELSL